MRYLYSWLKEHYPGIPSLEALQPLLIQLGHDIEEVQPVTHPGVVVAEIIAIEPHPNADRLSYVTVTNGVSEPKVVCGAPHLEVGQRVAYAPIGTELACGLKIAPIKVRGVASEGMLCAEDELGIGPSHKELLPLPKSAPVGDSIETHIPADAIVSLDITRDRGDVLSHFGLARDIKAGHEHQLLTPEFLIPTYSSDTSAHVSIRSIHPDTSALSLGLVEAEREHLAYPLIIASRLQLLGYKSINLATDLTNYLLLEYGQPLHAYDVDKLGAHPDFGVRRARTGEQLAGLNGTMYRLTPQSLTITNHDTPIALAGVLGGESTKIQKTTTRVLIESASFAPKSISLMARGLNLFTESALRFERGIDPDLRANVLAHAQALWQQFTSGNVYRPLEQINKHSEEITATTIVYERLNRFIGIEVEVRTIDGILEGLGCHVNRESSSRISVTPPSWRFDLALPEDYYEEVVRVIGLDTIPKQPLPASVPQWKRSKYWRIEGLKDLLVSAGAYEISTYPFLTRDEALPWAATEALIELAVPAQESRDVYRPSLIPGMLTALAANPDIPTITFFEMANVYRGGQENLMLAISASGSNQIDIENWWQNLFERLHLPLSSWMARINTISDDQRQKYKIRKPIVMVLELPVEEIISSKQFESPQVIIPDLDKITYTPPVKFQASRRDIAFIVDASVRPERVIKELERLHPHIASVELFDLYTDNKLGRDKYSLAFHIFYQSPERTLTSEEVQGIHKVVEAYIQEHYHGTIR